MHQRFTAWLPRALVTEAKAHAAARGESIARLVTRALRQELDTGRSEAVAGGRNTAHGGPNTADR
jgi:hypothetical protein